MYRLIPTTLLLILSTPVLAVLGGSSSNPVEIEVKVRGNELHAQIEAGALGADLTLTFDDARMLSEESIGLSAEVLQLPSGGVIGAVGSLAQSILNRLPDPLITVPDAFPLLITVAPPAGGGLSFVDTVGVEIHTRNLHLVENVPCRIIKAAPGEPFYDITESIGAGSIRSRGRTGGFSDFLIAVDLRPQPAVAATKLQRLTSRADDAAIPSALRTSLLGHLSDASSALAADDYDGAIDSVEDFADLVEDNAGTAIPNLWRAQRDVDNLAGELAAQASSLRFSLRMAASGSLF